VIWDINDWAYMEDQIATTDLPSKGEEMIMFLVT
jgi:hypothetical protein